MDISDLLCDPYDIREMGVEFTIQDTYDGIETTMF